MKEVPQKKNKENLYWECDPERTMNAGHILNSIFLVFL